VPAGPPPAQIVVKDLKRGTGPAVRRHTRIAIHYIGVDYKTRKPFEVRWSEDSQTLRQIDYAFDRNGWERSLLGMRVGGRRKLIIPAKFYKGGTAVVYVVDLLEVLDTSASS